MTECVGFEPTCPETDNRISSAARYDHFDNTPYKRKRTTQVVRAGLTGLEPVNAGVRVQCLTIWR